MLEDSLAGEGRRCASVRGRGKSVGEREEPTTPCRSEIRFTPSSSFRRFFLLAESEAPTAKGESEHNANDVANDRVSTTRGGVPVYARRKGNQAG